MIGFDSAAVLRGQSENTSVKHGVKVGVEWVFPLKVSLIDVVGNMHAKEQILVSNLVDN